MRTCLLLGGIALTAILAFASCGSKKNVVEPATTVRNVEGENVNLLWEETSGVEMVESLSEDGTKIVKRAVKWYAGTATADDKQTAIEMAELEARATVSRIISNIVTAKTERGTIANNGAVQKAIQSHWNQVSASVQNACEPMSETKVEYNPTTKMYSVTAKVGIRGDRFNQLLNSAGSFQPSDLSGDDLQQFIETNKNIVIAVQK